uniref:DNA polymerase III polC-type n=1 Tax=Lygus hesperus TaxID=30085 RepID=A0A0A9W0Y4_LYGHE
MSMTPKTPSHIAAQYNARYMKKVIATAVYGIATQVEGGVTPQLRTTFRQLIQRLHMQETDQSPKSGSMRAISPTHYFLNLLMLANERGWRFEQVNLDALDITDFTIYVPVHSTQ